MRKYILFDTLKKNKNLLILFAVMSVVNFSVFKLYRIMTEAFLYAEIIISVFMLLLITIDYIKNYKKSVSLKESEISIESGNKQLPVPCSFEESEYQKIIENLIKKINDTELEFSDEKQDINDWYTVWVHQIKTPIAVLKLKVPESEKDILNELFRIEEYADMALSYIRLGSRQNDLVFKEYSLDGIIREVLRKYASQFIAKKIKLCFNGTDKTVITDKKWLLCIIEQYISNAVKYTNNGTVTVTVTGDTLTVSDTGLGIAKEDLPRIFEKGYTGNNGRTDVKSSGLGLYLSKKASKLINVSLSADSTVGKGSKFSITFPETE